MNTFSIRLQDAKQTAIINDVISFVGQDGSGSFGIQAGHGRIMTSLSFGLARFRTGEDVWTYLALPGALLYFNDGTLTLSTRHFVIDEDYERISKVIAEELMAEEMQLRRLKRSLRQMEEEALRRMWQLGQKASQRD